MRAVKDSPATPLMRERVILQVLKSLIREVVTDCDFKLSTGASKTEIRFRLTQRCLLPLSSRTVALGHSLTDSVSYCSSGQVAHGWQGNATERSHSASSSLLGR
jgi:hypothetical protein